MASRNPQITFTILRCLKGWTRRSPPFGRSFVALFATMRVIASLELPWAESL